MDLFSRNILKEYDKISKTDSLLDVYRMGNPKLKIYLIFTFLFYFTMSYNFLTYVIDFKLKNLIIGLATAIIVYFLFLKSKKQIKRMNMSYMESIKPIEKINNYLLMQGYTDEMIKIIIKNNTELDKTSREIKKK